MGNESKNGQEYVQSGRKTNEEGTDWKEGRERGSGRQGGKEHVETRVRWKEERDGRKSEYGRKEQKRTRKVHTCTLHSPRTLDRPGL
jgi:hypothetical protein